MAPFGVETRDDFAKRRRWPEIRCWGELSRAAMIEGTIAEYRPYSDGRPAMIAKATPCGRTMIVPVIPAAISARSVRRVTIGHH